MNFLEWISGTLVFKSWGPHLLAIEKIAAIQNDGARHRFLNRPPIQISGLRPLGNDHHIVGIAVLHQWRAHTNENGLPKAYRVAYVRRERESLRFAIAQDDIAEIRLVDGQSSSIQRRILAESLSVHSTSWPIAAKQAPVTSPT